MKWILALGASVSLLLGAFSLAGATEVHLPESEPYAAEVDEIFARWERAQGPGCAVAVVRGGRVVHLGGYGLADLEHRAPIRASTVFDIGSLSKQFTAASIALLAASGELSLDDDIREYLPEMPDYGSPITIRHLVHHTSGIRGYFTLWSLMGRSIDDPMPPAEVLDLLVRQRELNFEPGVEQQYSNSNYFLLARVVERVTGRSLRAFARERLFAPLGMDDTRFYDDVGEILPGRSRSYAERGDGFERRLLKSTIVGDGGVYTTVEDLARWDANFYDNRLGGGEDLVATLLEPGRLTDGSVTPYAFGLRHGSYRGLPTIGHGGTMGGYRSYMVRFPTRRFTAIVLCNQLEISPYQLSHRIADLYLADDLAARAEPPPEPFLRGPDPPPDPPRTGLDPSVSSVYAGRYRSDEIDTTVTLEIRDGDLVLARRFEPPAALVARGEDHFELLGMGVVFTRDSDGGVAGLALLAGRVRRLAFVREGRP